MGIQQKLKHELKAVVIVMLFFSAWLGILTALPLYGGCLSVHSESIPI